MLFRSSPLLFISIPLYIHINFPGKKIESEKRGDVVSSRKAEDMEILMDSLQVMKIN